MKHFKLIFFFIINVLFITEQQQTLDFTENLLFKDLTDKKEFKFLANYKRDSGYKYLYIYSRNFEAKMNSNKAIIKIYFKQIPNKDSFQDLSLNYLNSDYSSIDFNSGLFIKLGDLNYDMAIVFVNSYETCNLRLQYKYTNEISFPPYSTYSNFQLNQFVLKKGATESIKYHIQQFYNDYLLILTKTSLRNIEVIVKYKDKDVTKEKLAYLYPNGCSIFLDKEVLDDEYLDFYITIKNKNKEKNEILLLGYVHHRDNEIFPNDVVNGFQLYLEGNKRELKELYISGKSDSKQYFTYQIYSKKLEIDFLTTGNSEKGSYAINEYNSMFSYKVDYEGKMRFQFFPTPKRNALYFQCIDYSNNEIAQKSLQPLVTGVPKSMTIPSGKSMYHFLPKERTSEKLFYYLRAKTKEKIYISFEVCMSYPENCTFTGKNEKSVEIIQNIGLWYTIPRNKEELQLIYVYCQNDCSYDILMTYEDNEPLFLFPDNDYTKFISDSGKDIFILPVFEFFQTSNTQSIYIDLTLIGGKADLSLRYTKDGDKLNCDIIKVGQKQSCIINSTIFLNDEQYFKKEIYAVVEQDKNYKNTIFNIMYGSEDSNSKLLKNNIINTEFLIVPETNKESEYTKTFTFKDSQNEFFISISTQLCQSKIIIDNNEKNSAYNHFYNVEKGSHNVKIYLIKDDNLCKEKFQDTVILFAYNSNGQVLLTENTLINTTITNNISFLHLFKPNEKIDDNSFNLEIERLGENSLSLIYELKKISFNGNDNNQLLYVNSSQKINSKKIRYISNKKINSICGSLEQNEVCSLRMTLIPSSASKFSLYLSKNGLYFSKNLTPKTLISSVNTKSVQYFYIDINENKNKNLELLINSYGQNLKFNYEVNNKKQEDNVALPLKKSFSDGSNNHQITIDQSNFSNCKDFCRLYIGVIAQNSEEDELSSLFSITYRYLNDENSFINLPLNYFIQYTIKDSNQVSYIINPIEDDDFTFELYTIKQNEIDDTEVIADISGAITYKLRSSEGKYVKTGSSKDIKVKITKSAGNDKATFKFRVSSTGKGNSFKGFIPMISSYEEKCLKKPCYYLLDDFSLDNEETSAYFYIPEKENSIINIKALKYDEQFSDEGYISSNDKMKRSNWHELSNINREKDVIIKIDDNDKVTLCPSYYNKPNNVTLNYGEKRMFTLRKQKIETIIFNIKQPSILKSKVKINIHSIRGNGIFRFKEEIYPLGLENAYKEDITIIIDDDKLYNIQLTAINEKNGKADTDNENAADFVFTIEYKIDLIDELLYEINYDKINSYKFYRKEKIDEILFYLNINKRSAKDLNMNIKIYSNLTQYDIKSYFVNNNFIQKRLNNSQPDTGLNVTKEAIQTYIQGGNSINNIFTFAKLEISSNELQNYVKDYPFICIIFTPKEKKNNYVKFDLYPYEMNNTIPLARNQLFIQKIPYNNDIYQLFLSKSDIFYRKNVKIDFVPPLLRKYDYSIAHFYSGNKDPKKSEDEFISDRKKVFGKEEITLNSLRNTTQKNIIFNIFPNDDLKIKDSFIFSYKNQKSDEEEEIYMKSSEYFNITGNSKQVKFTIHAPASKNTGHTVLISRVYEFEKIKHLDINKNNYYMSFYLLFSEIKPIFEKYEVLDDITIYDSKRTIPYKIKKGGDLYFTAICVLEDNEREIYFAYEGIRKKIDDKNALDDLLDYMKDHVFASIIILIVILIILGMLINICRSERKVGRLSSVKVDVEGKLMEEKSD